MDSSTRTDANLGHSIDEAINSLKELKRQLEESRQLELAGLNTERQTLKGEITALRKEQAILVEDLKQQQKLRDQAVEQQKAAEKEAQQMINQAQTERDRIQQEISRLTGEMNSLGSQMQTLLQERFHQLWGNFVESISKQKEASSFNNLKEPAISHEPEPELKASPSPSSTQPAKVLISVPGSRESGREIKIEGSSPSSPASSSTLEASPPPAEAAEEADRTQVMEPFKPPTMPNPVTVKMERVNRENGFTGQSQEPDPSSIQRNQKQIPRLQRIFGRRETLPGRQVEFSPPAADSSASGVQTVSFEDQPTYRPDQVLPGLPVKVPKDDDRLELEEIGAKLGLEVVTPPNINQVRFAAGFKPNNSSSSATARTEAVPHPEALANPVEYFPESASPDTFEPGLNERVDDKDFATPAPRLGEIGDDFAQAFSSPQFDLPGMMQFPSNQPESMDHFQSTSLIPPGGPFSEHFREEDLETKVKISNLQGLSLLMMEKVVRGLPGVHHVTVTDFRKGVLEMEVRHSLEVKLDQVLPEIQDLRLMLVERGPNSLEFLQER